MNYQKKFLKTVSIAMLSTALLAGCIGSGQRQSSSVRDDLPLVAISSAENDDLPLVAISSAENDDSSSTLNTLDELTSIIQSLESSIESRSDGNNSLPAGFQDQWQQFSDKFAQFKKGFQTNDVLEKIQADITKIDKIPSINSRNSEVVSPLPPVDRDSLTASLSNINNNLIKINRSLSPNSTVTQSPSLPETSVAPSSVQQRRSEDTNFFNIIFVAVIIFVIAGLLCILCFLLYTEYQSESKKTSKLKQNVRRVTTQDVDQKLSALESQISVLDSEVRRIGQRINASIPYDYEKIQQLLEVYARNNPIQTEFNQDWKNFTEYLEKFSLYLREVVQNNINQSGVQHSSVYNYHEETEFLKRENKRVNDNVKKLEINYNSFLTQLQSDLQQIREELRDVKNLIQKPQEKQKSEHQAQNPQNIHESWQTVSPSPNLSQTQLSQQVKTIVSNYNRNGSLQYNTDSLIAGVQIIAHVCEPPELYDLRRNGLSSNQQLILKTSNTQSEYQVISATGANTEFWLFPKYTTMEGSVYNTSGKDLFDFDQAPKIENSLFKFKIIRPANVRKGVSEEWILEEKGIIQTKW